MTRFFILLIVIAITFATIIGCSTHVDENNDSEITIFGLEQFLTFNDAIDLSDVIVVATYISSEISNEQVKSKFNVSEVLRGDINEDVVYIFDSIGHSSVFDSELSYQTGSIDYKVNKEYLLILSRNDSLFLDYPQHAIISGLFIPIDNIEKSTMYGEPLFEMADIRSTSDIRSTIHSAKAPNNDEGQRYTSATDLPTIILESDYILEIEIIDLYVEGIYANSNTYYCRIINNLRGENINTIEDTDVILVSFIKDSVEIGESYIIMVNRVGRKSLIYTQSSLRSVISMYDVITIEEIKMLID